MTDTPRTTSDDEINDLEEILMLGPPPVDEIIREIQADGAIRFTWDYDQARPALEKLYAKAKRSQWDAATDIDWSQDVDPERIARGLLEATPRWCCTSRRPRTTRPSRSTGGPTSSSCSSPSSTRRSS